VRLLKSGAARSLEACARLVGHSPRQVARWWATYRRAGLEALLREPVHPGTPPRLTPAALAALETAMAAGGIATRKDAQAYLAAEHGIVYRSLNGVWAQVRKHKIKPTTGRRRHELADAQEQAAFAAGFRDELARGRREAGVGL
jgi:transposase